MDMCVCVLFFFSLLSLTYCSLSLLPPMLMPPISLEDPIFLSWDSADIQAQALQNNKERGTASQKAALHR